MRSMQSPRPACGQCRARRVRCDRASGRCSACSRLQLDCSYSSNAPATTHGESGTLPNAGRHGSPDLTQAGIRRRRIRNACEPCRTSKAKCSGGDVCSRCIAKGVACVKRTDTTTPDSQLAHEQQQSDLGHAPNTGARRSGQAEVAFPTPTTERDTVMTSSPPTLDETERRLIRAYFDRTDSTTCNILHAATVLRDWNRGKLDPALRKVICAEGLRSQDPAHHRDPESVSAWMDDAQRLVLSQMNSFSLPRLQALVLIVSYRLSVGHIASGWNLHSLAARQAYILRLNHERADLDPIHQESRRRTMWVIYAIDRKLCGGLEDLTVCPVKSMANVRLPCEDRTFERGMPSRAQFLDPFDSGPTGQQGDMDIVAYLLRLYATRDRILRYTKGILRDNASPALTEETFTSLEKELDTFPSSLPSDIQLSAERLTLMAHSRDATGYFTLHTIWHQGYLDLYRCLVPGMREALGRDAIDATPPDFVLYCQTRCFRRAVQMVEMWYYISQGREKRSVSEAFFVACMYQATQVLHHLGHMVGQDPERMEAIKSKLRVVLELASPIMHEGLAPLADCLHEIDRLIDRLGEVDPASEKVTRSPLRESGNRHMASKGSFIPRDLSDSSQHRASRSGSDDSTDEPTEHGVAASQHPVQRPNNNPYSVDAAAGLGQVPFVSSSIEFYPQAGRDDGFIPWDSFTPQMTDTYDSGLTGLCFNL